jgi:hypothetical protein
MTGIHRPKVIGAVLHRVSPALQAQVRTSFILLPIPTLAHRITQHAMSIYVPVKHSILAVMLITTDLGINISDSTEEQLKLRPMMMPVVCDLISHTLSLYQAPIK